jgi:hypothetical protein
MKRTTRKRRPRQPNFLRKLRYLYRLGALPVGAVHMVDILHDGWCAHFEGRPCDCDPIVKLKYSVADHRN